MNFAARITASNLSLDRYKDALKSLRTIQKKGLPAKIANKEAKHYLQLAHRAALDILKGGGKLPKAYKYEEDMYRLGTKSFNGN